MSDHSVSFVPSVYFSTSPRSVTVYLGRQTQEGSNPNLVTRSVTQIINHPDYDSRSSDNDIALLKLSSAVTFNNFVLPVCLPASDSTFHNGTDAWVTGWGNIGSGGGSGSMWITSIYRAFPRLIYCVPDRPPVAGCSIGPKPRPPMLADIGQTKKSNKI